MHVQPKEARRHTELAVKLYHSGGRRFVSESGRLIFRVCKTLREVQNSLLDGCAARKGLRNFLSEDTKTCVPPNEVIKSSLKVSVRPVLRLSHVCSDCPPRPGCPLIPHLHGLISVFVARAGSHWRGRLSSAEASLGCIYTKTHRRGRPPSDVSTVSYCLTKKNCTEIRLFIKCSGECRAVCDKSRRRCGRNLLNTFEATQGDEWRHSPTVQFKDTVGVGTLDSLSAGLEFSKLYS